MKILAPMISICLMIFLSGLGCSKEEQPALPVKNPKVVKPIIKPAPKKEKISSSAEKEMAEPEKKEIKEVKTATITGDEATTKPEEKEKEEVKTASVEEKSVKIQEAKAREKEKAIEKIEKEEPGYYFAKRGDTLASIAGKEDVYGDPLKWPFLYRMNMDKLGKLQAGDDLPVRELPEGLKMKIITPDEVKKNLKERANNIWVINILSAMTIGEIVPSAVKLMKNGYPAYITTARVKEKDWMRLRVGFYKNRTEANAKGKKIKSMLNFVDSWTTTVGKEEFVGFGGY